MINGHDLKLALADFSGTENWHRYFPPNVLLTDGIVYLIEAAECGWLIDILVSHLPAMRDRNETLAFAFFSFEARSGRFRLVDDMPANVVYAEQEFEHFGFPLPELKLYASWDGEFFVICLPGER